MGGGVLISVLLVCSLCCTLSFVAVSTAPWRAGPLLSSLRRNSVPRSGARGHRQALFPCFVHPKQVEKVLGAGRKFQFRESKTALDMATGDKETFSSEEEYYDFLRAQGDLPAGFSVGTAGFKFKPVEIDTQAKMNVTVITVDEPSDSWAAVFTKNMFPGCPVIVGRNRLAEGASIQAIVVNNKISNVCPGGVDGVADSEAICDGVAKIFGLQGKVIPSSTGVIGWSLPRDAIIEHLPEVKAHMQSKALFPAAKSIMTTDRFPKLRGVDIGSTGARLVGIAKGAGMIEPNMATMLVYILTDLDLPGSTMQKMLKATVDESFNCISIDSDTSTSDTVVLLSSKKVPAAAGAEKEFEAALKEVCVRLAEDVVRNGEGTGHVLKVTVRGAPSDFVARRIGKEVINSPLFCTAIAGNDPNVGRLLAVVGRVMGIECPDADVSGTTLAFGDRVVFQDGAFRISQEAEDELYKLFKDCEMVQEGKHLPYPPHFKCIDIDVDLKLGPHDVTCWGSDLTDEYVHINADYRS